MRPRRVLVKAHRWLALGLMAWLVVVALTGAWLVESHQLDAWLHPGRYDAVGRRRRVRTRAIEAAEAEMPRRRPRLRRHPAGERPRRLPGRLRDRTRPANGRDADLHVPDGVRRSRAPARSTASPTTRPGSPGGSTGATCTCGRTTASSACSTPTTGWCRAVERRRTRRREGRRVRRHPRRHGHGRLARGRVHRDPAHRLLPLVLAGREALGQRAAHPTRPRPVHVQHVAAQGRSASSCGYR